MSSRPLYPADLPVDHLRPSLFELLAQEQLRDLLHPVVRYILTYLAQHYPRYFLRVLNNHEEFFAALLLIVERHHLLKHDASISEHFYQLKLAPAKRIPTPRLDSLRQGAVRRAGLSRRQRWGLLLFLVGLPYARARLQDYFERLSGPDQDTGDSSLELTAVGHTKLQRAFRIIYPYANLALDGVLLGYDIAYMFEKTPYYRPWLKWLGVRVVRDDGQGEQPLSKKSLFSKLPPLLPPLLLLLKLSQWWYSPSSPRHISVISTTNDIAKIHAGILPPRPLDILPHVGLHPRDRYQDPPPPYDEEERVSDDAETDSAVSKTTYKIDRAAYGTCPLCGDKWKNPAILPSGWVVCWRCGWEALEGDDESELNNLGDVEDGAPEQPQGRRMRGKCPITGLPVTKGQLRRVLV